MQKNVRIRFWFEAICAAASGCLAIVTLWLPGWIEVVFKVDLDDGTGALEWAIVGVTATTSFAMFALARKEWRLRLKDAAMQP